MSSAVRIGTWDVEYASRRAQGRLAPVLARVIESELERALEGAGGDERLLIRELDLDVRLDLNATDAALAQAFSRAIAQQVWEAARPGGSANAVRYASASAALFDLLASFARGDSARLWAWQRLELVAGDPCSEGGGAQLVRSLCARPREIVAQLASLAREPALWAGFARRLPAGALHELAGAALSALEVKSAALEPGRAARADGGAAPAAAEAMDRRAEAIARRSWIARASIAARLALPAESDAITALAIAEADPGALRGSTAAALSVALRDRLEGASASHVPRRSPAMETAARAQPFAAQDAPSAAHSTDPVHRLARDAAVSAAETRPAGPARSADSAVAVAPDDAAPSKPMPIASPAPDELAASEPALPPREEAFTRRAGLLFLLHVLAEIDRAQEWLTQPAFAARSTRFTLHALAALLADCDERDPAALAFAGLAPSAQPPSRGEPALARAEIAALRTRVAAIDARLLQRLGPEPTRAEICARDGAVLHEPGWIELRMPLGSVDTRLRRAGLDLHPDFVPWLGAVVRFSYV